MRNKIFHSLVIASIMILMSCSSQKLASTEDGERSAVAEQKELIRKNIKDPQKQADLLQIVGEIEKQSQEFFNFYKEHKKIIVQLNKNYQTSRQDFDQAFAGFNEQYENYLQMLISKRNEMRLLTSAQEWTKIMDREISFITQ
jgi:thiamine biosynthesis lipoprotein ApbE